MLARVASPFLDQVRQMNLKLAPRLASLNLPLGMYKPDSMHLFFLPSLFGGFGPVHRRLSFSDRMRPGATPPGPRLRPAIWALFVEFAAFEVDRVHPNCGQRDGANYFLTERAVFLAALPLGLAIGVTLVATAADASADFFAK